MLLKSIVLTLGISSALKPPEFIETSDGEYRALHMVVTRLNLGQSHLKYFVASRRKEMELFSKPSLQGQKDRRFVWILFVDPEAVDALESERKQNGDDWYVFVKTQVDLSTANSGRHARIFSALESVFSERITWIEFAKAMRLNHLLVTSLDIDDALSNDYFSKVHDWYNSAGAWNGLKGACSSRALLWLPDAQSPGGLVRDREEFLSQGCLASGLVVAYPIEYTLRLSNNDTNQMYQGSHEQIRAQNPDMFTVVDRPILRMRAITSVSAKDVVEQNTTKRRMLGMTAPNFQLLSKEFNVNRYNLYELNNYLVQAAPDIAREILHFRSARGCSVRFHGSCGKNIWIACAILNFLPPECQVMKNKKFSNRRTTSERRGDRRKNNIFRNKIQRGEG